MYLRDLQLQEDDFEVAIKVKISSGALNFSVNSNISVEKRLASWHAGNHSGDSKAEIFQFAEFFSVVFNFFGNHLLGTWSFLC